MKTRGREHATDVEKPVYGAGAPPASAFKSNPSLLLWVPVRVQLYTQNYGVVGILSPSFGLSLSLTKSQNSQSHIHF
ncbi:hypothetical protein SLEP1_g34129 [Rubroshorea leprosula]|uniref:Uncharacterized protein n=1 Tax=Rubroshorea leprosula TaxID=152421 RepID=A0AAV5KIU4_9ROSI|nr:hypothetical protein SLEP1_g34129 [Rubroshorea leprosula]